MIRMYWHYLMYILEHKKNVGIEAWKMGLYWHAITHDLSKFLPAEFFPYAWKFYCPVDWETGVAGQKLIDEDFRKAWALHYGRNKHHWNHWVDKEGHAKPMPHKYIRQMVADWRGMSRKFGDTARSYYEKEAFSMNLNPLTRDRLVVCLTQMEGL
jgi:hypothetical protein